MNDQITRKEFLSGATKSVVAVSACAAGMTALAVNAQTGQAGKISQAVPAWPWPYTSLDPEEIRKKAHKFYYDGGCCYGAFHAIISTLAEKLGEPFTLVPTQMMYFGGGGAAGWGTLCGALNGCAAAIGMVVDRANANAIIGELFGWHTQATLPSDISNQYAQQHLFLVNRNDAALKQTVPNTVLCHASVSAWCTQAGIKATAPERGERCARLTGDVAARAVEMLNAYKDGAFRAAYVTPENVSDCHTCHGGSGYIGNVQSGVKMSCPHCHRNWDHLY